MPMKVNVLSASTLIGDNIRNREDEDLGSLEEIMIDLETGRIVYAVLSSGGLLGIGDKLFAIPWEALRVDPANEELVLDADEEKLAHAPEIDQDEWPQILSRRDYTWLTASFDYWGYTPSWHQGR